jgi:hypothetical protein
MKFGYFTLSVNHSESNHRGFYRRWAELMTDG